MINNEIIERSIEGTIKSDACVVGVPVKDTIKRANKEVLKAHMTHCVHDAVNSKDCDQKIEEMIKVLDNLLK